MTIEEEVAEIAATFYAASERIHLDFYDGKIGCERGKEMLAAEARLYVERLKTALARRIVMAAIADMADPED